MGKAGADHADGVGFAVEIHLHLRLQDEPLGKKEVVRAFELRGEMALATHIAGELDIEKIRRETLNAQRSPIAGRA